MYQRITAYFKFLVGLWMQASSTERVLHFTRTVTVVSTAAGTAVEVIGDDEVPEGFTPYVTDFLAKVNGAVAWTVMATLTLEDTAGVDFMSIAVAALTANAVLLPGTANVTLANAMVLGTGGTAEKGIRVIANANAGAGSDFVITVRGFYKKA
jgi:hypothetical protein